MTVGTMKITEQDLIDIGFERTDVPPEESGDNYEWYYYTLSVCQIDFITMESDKVEDGAWSVEFFNTYPPIKITNLETFKTLYNTLKTIEDEQNTP